jgi:glutamyl/glutaminyl-tRNA synthetase
VDETDTLSSRYDMIIGRDLLEELGINFLFKEHLMEWDNASTPMLDPAVFNTDQIDDLEQEFFYIHDPITTEAERIQAILDAKYCKADLEQIVQECKQLDKEEQQKLLALLQKYEALFDGTVGTWNTEPVDILLKDPNCTPYHAKSYSVPHSQEQKLREEVDRLCKQSILRKINRSEWACPMFTISKPDGSLRSLADLRELNKRIKRHPYPIPKIQDMLQKLEGFMYATSLDLNMGYYHLLLTPNASRYLSGKDGRANGRPGICKSLLR